MPTRQPNIILFLTDQHRLSALNCYGPTPCRTPNIDRLASDGVRFETAYTCCPVCSPARASLMTGVHVHAHGMLSNNFELGTCVSQLPDGPHLLSRRLASVGYRCGYVGKWHLGTERMEWFGSSVDVSTPTTRGFEMVQYRHDEHLARLGLKMEVRRTHRRLPCGRFDAPVEASVPYWLAEQTNELIDRFAQQDAPFFIVHSDPGPHASYTVPETLFEQYRDVDIPQWPNYDWNSRAINRPHQVKIHPHADTMTWDDWAEGIRHYYANVTLIDMQLGRIRDHLARRGLSDNTVIIFTSDHGETLGSHGGLVDKGYHHFEEIQRIGMVVHDPRGWGSAGRRSGDVVAEWASLLDMYPTVLELAGAECDTTPVHGRSLAPLLRGNAAGWRDEMFVEFFGVNNMSATMLTCRHGDLKYGWNGTCCDELYDLEADPHETSDLVDDPAYAGRLKEMRERVSAFMLRTEHKALGLFRASRP